MSLPTDNSTSSVNDSSEVDLFADADFVSAMPEPESGKSPVPQVRLPPICEKRVRTFVTGFELAKINELLFSYGLQTIALDFFSVFSV